MAPPSAIEGHLARYLEAHGTADRNHRAKGSDTVTVPEYFQRKRMEEALRASNEQLERRVAERTTELESANKALQAEIIERELAEEERRKVQVKLLHAQKLESLGVLSGGIAHDFNNLLVGILGNAGLAMLELPAESPARTTLHDIETAALRAAELTRQLLAYAGKGQFVVGPVNLSLLVEEMANLLATAVSKNARLDLQLEGTIPPVEADATQLRQVVMNLITNASEAIGTASGTITVRTGVMDADRPWLADAQLGAGLPEGPYAYVEVQDDGHGMHPATQARIFDPFFTTKFTGRGLGLAAVLGIVRAHHGAIRVASAPGRGTTIRIVFPAGGEVDETVRRRSDPAMAALDERTGTILVVDDEETVRNVARRILTSNGFSVRMAAGGVEAMHVLRQDPQAIDAVLLDLTMPDMSGTVTRQELQRIRPDIKVVFSSGYSQSDAFPVADGNAGLPFIQKPYRPADLVATIRRVLG
jgi:signal transduction histidine kinase